MTDFQSFRNAVLENDDLQEQVISIINTATANGSGLGDGITTLACTSSDHMAPMGPLSKRYFSARCFSSLAC